MMARRWHVVVLLSAVLVVAGGAVAADDDEAAPEAGTFFVTTVDFSNMQKTALEGSAGDVEVTSVEFVASNVKSGGIKGAFS